MATDEPKTGATQTGQNNLKQASGGIELSDSVDHVAIEHNEALSPCSTLPAWKSLAQGDGDTALALFDNVDQLNEIVDPIEERRLVRKIDWLILPCLVVCYTFYYVRLLKGFDVNTRVTRLCT
jgi:hypothetical protein